MQRDATVAGPRSRIRPRRRILSREAPVFFRHPSRAGTLRVSRGRGRCCCPGRGSANRQADRAAACVPRLPELLSGFPAHGDHLRRLRARSDGSRRARADHERGDGGRRPRIHGRLHRGERLRRHRPDTEDRHHPVGSRRRHPPSDRERAAGRLARLPHEGRRAAATRRLGEAGERRSSARCRRRSLEELGVQPARLGFAAERRVEPGDAARREHERRSHHPGLEDHVWRRARSRNRGIRSRRRGSGQGRSA